MGGCVGGGGYHPWYRDIAAALICTLSQPTDEKGCWDFAGIFSQAGVFLGSAKRICPSPFLFIENFMQAFFFMVILYV